MLASSTTNDTTSTSPWHTANNPLYPRESILVAYPHLKIDLEDLPLHRPTDHLPPSPLHGCRTTGVNLQNPIPHASPILMSFVSNSIVIQGMHKMHDGTDRFREGQKSLSTIRPPTHTASCFPPMYPCMLPRFSSKQREKRPNRLEETCLSP